MPPSRSLPWAKPGLRVTHGHLTPETARPIRTSPTAVPGPTVGMRLRHHVSPASPAGIFRSTRERRDPRPVLPARDRLWPDRPEAGDADAGLPAGHPTA